MRKLLFILLFISYNCFSANVTVTIKQDGSGDYTTLAAALTGYANKNLPVSSIDTLFFKMDGTWSSSDVSSAITSGYTTDPTHQIKIYTTTTARHKGVYSTNYYRLECGGNCLTITTEHTIVDGLQIYMNVNASGTCLRYAPTRNSQAWNVKISNNIFRAIRTSTILVYMYGFVNVAAGGLTGISGYIKVWNNIAYDCNTASINSACYSFETGTAGFSAICYNNTAAYGQKGYLIGSHRIFNCIAQNCTQGYNGAGSAASDYNISDLADAPTNGHSQNSVTVTFVDKPNNNYNLDPTDAIAKNNGTDLSADAYIPFNTDNVNNTRPVYTNWSCGANEKTYVPPVVTVSPFKPQIIIIN